MSNRHVGTNKDVEKLVKVARKAGVTVEVTRGNHLKWTAPNHAIYYCGLTSSDEKVVVRKLRKFLISNVEGIRV